MTRAPGAALCAPAMVTRPGRGIARAMCRHSLDHARGRGFRAMQYNIVVSTNERAVRLWQAMGSRSSAGCPARSLTPCTATSMRS